MTFEKFIIRTLSTQELLQFDEPIFDRIEHVIVFKGVRLVLEGKHIEL